MKKSKEVKDRIDRDYKKYLKEYKYYKSIEAHIDDQWPMPLFDPLFEEFPDLQGIEEFTYDHPEPLSKTEFLIKWIDTRIMLSGVGRATKAKSSE